jgi:poly(A)-specific ribonuclease
VSFSSETCEFLRGHNLDLGKIFSEGIHYLSVQEERDLTKAWEDDQTTRENKPEIIIPPNDAAAHKFYRDAKKRIREWVEDESVSLLGLKWNREANRVIAFKRSHYLYTQ